MDERIVRWRYRLDIVRSSFCLLVFLSKGGLFADGILGWLIGRPRKFATIFQSGIVRFQGLNCLQVFGDLLFSV